MKHSRCPFSPLASSRTTRMGPSFRLLSNSPAFPLYATVRFNSHGASLSRVNWVKKIVEGGNDLQLVKWTNLRGVTTANKLGYLKRTTGGHGWNEGAYSARAITKVGDEIRGISADCMRQRQTSDVWFVSPSRGLTTTSKRSTSLSTATQATALDVSQSIYVVRERLEEKDSRSSCARRDCSRSRSTMTASSRTTSMASSSTRARSAPSFPLYADASLGTTIDAELANARWVQKIVQGANNLQFDGF